MNFGVTLRCEFAACACAAVSCSPTKFGTGTVTTVGVGVALPSRLPNPAVSPVRDATRKPLRLRPSPGAPWGPDGQPGVGERGIVPGAGPYGRVPTPPSGLLLNP